MVATRSARERKARLEAGPLAEVRIDVGTDDQFVYKIACTTCTTTAGKGNRSERPWSAYRPGDDNGYLAAMDRWILHLAQKHPESEAPCRAYQEAAEERLQQRRDSRDKPSH